MLITRISASASHRMVTPKHPTLVNAPLPFALWASTCIHTCQMAAT